MTVTTRAVAALVAVVWSLSAVGCGSTTDGKPVEATSAPTADPDEPAGLFDPCTEISDDLLRQMGVDPATEEADLAGVEFPGWKVCSWDAGWYFLGVLSGDRTVDEVKSNPSVTNVRNVEIGSRSALEFDTTGDERRDECSVGIVAPQGVIEIHVGAKFLEPKPEDPCAAARRHANELDSFLPR